MRVFPSVEYVRGLLDYDPSEGFLRWKPRPPEAFRSGRHSSAHSCAKWNTRYAGKIAGTLTGGYYQVSIDDRLYKAHRVIWLIVTGEWPCREIDHADCDPGNNKWENLRLATGSQNKANRRIRADNKSGRKGVTWHKAARKWDAQLTKDYQHYHLGFFDTLEEAAEAYERAAERLHGEFARAK